MRQERLYIFLQFWQLIYGWEYADIFCRTLVPPGPIGCGNASHDPHYRLACRPVFDGRRLQQQMVCLPPCECPSHHQCHIEWNKELFGTSLNFPCDQLCTPNGTDNILIYRDLKLCDREPFNPLCYSITCIPPNYSITPTINPTPEASCALHCGKTHPVGECECTIACVGLGTCCSDFKTQCKPLLSSCAGNCEGKAIANCWCDAHCIGANDCCVDYNAVCTFVEPTCDGSCGKQTSHGCWCDPNCVSAGDCCDDYQVLCRSVDSKRNKGVITLMQRDCDECGAVLEIGYRIRTGNMSTTCNHTHCPPPIELASREESTVNCTRTLRYRFNRKHVTSTVLLYIYASHKPCPLSLSTSGSRVRSRLTWAGENSRIAYSLATTTLQRTALESKIWPIGCVVVNDASSTAEIGSLFAVVLDDNIMELSMVDTSILDGVGPCP
jgi:hypothetical protein